MISRRAFSTALLAGAAASLLSTRGMAANATPAKARNVVLVHGLFGFFARHEAIRSGHGARIGLVGIEYTVLISIGHLTVHEGDVSVNRIAEHLYLSGAFVTTVTNKLLQRGLIHKTPDPNDRRRVRLEISEKGWPGSRSWRRFSARSTTSNSIA